MRNEKAIAELAERYAVLNQDRENKIIEDLCELIFNGVEKILDKELSVFSIVLQKNHDTDCIDIVFQLEEYENIAKSIENRHLLRISTEIRYFETTLEFCHKRLADWHFVMEELNSGDYNEDEVSFVMNR